MKTTQETSAPWYKFGHVWLIAGGPAIVVVASIFTAYLAMSRPDPVLDEDYYQKGLQVNKQLEADAASHAPAMQARNHIGTGGIPTQHAKP